MRCGRWLVMPSTRSWCSADMVSTFAPSRRQNAASRSTAVASTCDGGVRMHQRSTNSSAKPASGPEFSVPATGWAGTKCTPAGMCGDMSRTIMPFTEPTSETIVPGARCGAISAATAPQAPTGIATITRSAPSAAAALVSTTWSATPSSATRRRVAADRAVATIERAAPCARAARAIEEPIRPIPISARRLNKATSAFMGRSNPAARRTASRLPSHELRQRGDHHAVRLLTTDRHAQRVRQFVGLDPTQDQAALRQECIRILRGTAAAFGKVDQHEIGDAWRHLQSKLAKFDQEPIKPFFVVGARCFQMRPILERGYARRHGRRIDVEWPADAVDRVDYVCRPVKPTEPERGQPMDFRERAAHDNVFASGDKLDASLVVVTAHVFGIGRVEHEQHVRGQTPLQPLDFVERNVGAGRVVGIGE